jgi:hypothetical protein
MGRATTMTSLDRHSLSQWLKLPSEPAVEYPAVAEAIANGIVDPDREDITVLANQVWGDSPSLAAH